MGIFILFGIGFTLQSYKDATLSYQASMANMEVPRIIDRPPLPEEKKEVTLPYPEKKNEKKKEEIPDESAAPRPVSSLKEDQATAYIDRFKKIAVLEMKKYGIPASISLAQGLIESGAGTSRLAVKANNHFGIKCFSKRCKAGHCINASDDSHKDYFKKFGNAWESWRAHSLMLAGGRYSKLKKYGKDYRKWAVGLRTAGYATDKAYASKLIGVIEKYDLHRFDR